LGSMRSGFANDGRSGALASLFSACLQTHGDDQSRKSMVVAVASPRNQPKCLKYMIVSKAALWGGL
jgi:hypothetical protein